MRPFHAVLGCTGVLAFIFTIVWVRDPGFETPVCGGPITVPAPLKVYWQGHEAGEYLLVRDQRGVHSIARFKSTYRRRIPRDAVLVYEGPETPDPGSPNSLAYLTLRVVNPAAPRLTPRDPLILRTQTLHKSVSLLQGYLKAWQNRLQEIHPRRRPRTFRRVFVQVLVSILNSYHAQPDLPSLDPRRQPWTPMEVQRLAEFCSRLQAGFTALRPHYRLRYAALYAKVRRHLTCPDPHAFLPALNGCPRLRSGAHGQNPPRPVR